MNVLFKIIEYLARILNDYDIGIIKAHHKNKVDAPSRTVVKTYEIIGMYFKKIKMRGVSIADMGL